MWSSETFSINARMVKVSAIRDHSVTPVGLTDTRSRTGTGHRGSPAHYPRHRSNHNVGIATAATVAKCVGDTQTAISSQSGTFGALGAVLSGIDVFVKTVDQTAGVRG
jgi:hypothetical protein